MPQRIGALGREGIRTVAACLGAASDFEHLRAAYAALAFRCRAAVLHRGLNRVFDLALGFALDAIRFCCQLWYLRSARLFRWARRIPPARPSCMTPSGRDRPACGIRSSTTTGA